MNDFLSKVNSLPMYLVVAAVLGFITIMIVVFLVWRAGQVWLWGSTKSFSAGPSRPAPPSRFCQV